MHMVRCDTFSEDGDLAGSRMDESERDAKRRSLARAVRPEQAEDFAFIHADVHRVHGLMFSEDLGQVFGFENDSSHSFPLCYPPRSWREKMTRDVRLRRRKRTPIARAACASDMLPT